MLTKRRDSDYLKDIMEAMRRIVAYIEGLSYEQFMEDTKTQDAVIRNIEVIGEATKNLSEGKTPEDSLERDGRDEGQAYPSLLWR